MSGGAVEPEPAVPKPGRLRRVLMKVFGPADLAEEHQHNPLVGTKYDPAHKQRRHREGA